MKSKKFLKLTALFLCIMMLLPMLFACGEKPETAGSSADAATTEAEITEAPTPAPTPEPTTPEPTEPPTTREPFVVDANLSYWDQIYSELEYYGLVGGVPIFAGDDEATLMKKFGANSAKKEELDVSGDNVPFSAAYRVYTTKDMTNFWDASYAVSLKKDVPVEEGDIIAGVLWIKGRRSAESDMYDADADANFYMAVKTPTDGWATEGDMSPAGIHVPQNEEWQKILFSARIMNEETQSSTVGFNIYIGYGIQEFEIGGIVAYLFPSTPENEKAVWSLPIE